MPVLTATIIAAVGAPVIAWLERRRVPRAAGSGLLLLGILALAVVIGAVVLGGITSQAADAGHKLNAAADKIATALKDAGVGHQTTDAAKIGRAHVCTPVTCQSRM